MRNRLWIPIVCLGLSIRAIAQGIPAAEIDSLVGDLMSEQSIPGAVVGVVEKGRLVFANAYGLADIDARRPMEVGTRFELGSLSDTFLVASALKLADQKKLDLDASVSTLLKGLPVGWKDLKVRNLIEQTSGLPEILESEKLDPLREESFADLVKIASEMPGPLKPGQTPAYCLTNGLLLSEIVGLASGKKVWSDFAKEWFWQPVGMKSMERLSMLAGTKLATGYSHSEKGFERVSASSPALRERLGGGIVGTLADFAKWDASTEDEKLLSKNGWKQLQTAQAASVFGAAVDGPSASKGKEDASQKLEALGFGEGFSGGYVRIPGKRMSILVFCNVDAVDGVALANQILDLIEATRN